MLLIQLVIIFVVFGVILWATNTYIPIKGTIKKILNAVIIVVAIVFALSAFGFMDFLSGLQVGR